MEDIRAKEWLNDNELSYQIWDKKYRRNNETFEQWLDRVSNKNNIVKELIESKRFIFGGRTLANRGIENSGSYSNCYSIGYVEDHLEDILQANTDIAKTFCAHGGQGLSLSKIRPEGTLIKKTYTTDGIVPFMKMFNTTTETISQGGSRKGALMMSLDVWHPEIEKFISIKSDANAINKANLSVEIDDEFMMCVKQGVTEVNRTFKYDGGEMKYTVNPVAIFEKICENALKHAEPGVLFTNRLRNYNLMEFVDGYEIETTNPCGEQPLPRHGACNLCSINLSEYVVNPFTTDAYIDVELLQKDIKVIVEVMDDVLEENIERHALQGQIDMARKYRNIGIGVMGVADMFVKMGLTYGSEESVGLIRKVMQLILRYSLSWSVIFGEKKGSFPGYDKNIWESNIFTHLMNNDKDSIEYFKSTNTLRNATLLSVAPTGSIGTMFDVSTGIEPFFRLGYVRTTKSLNGKDEDYKCEIKALKEYREITGNNDTPEYFITSDKIHWKDRINVQAAIQEFCDTGISSTINLPKSTTLQDIKDLYLYAYDKGLKGVTVYVDGSREGILTENGNHKINCERQLNNAVKRPKSLDSTLYPIKVKGEYFGIIVGYLENEPYELFAVRLPDDKKNITQHNGKTIKHKKNCYGFESDLLNINNMLETELNDEEKLVTLTVSQLLRHDVGIKYIVKTIKKTSSSIASFSSAICRVLSKYVEKEVTGEKCPNCGEELIMEGGCTHCSSCEYSKCGD